MSKLVLLGIGLPKTGTRSLCTALNILGIKAQHDRHFFMGRTPAHIARSIELSPYEAFLDWPHPLGSGDNMYAFARVALLLPESRLILTTRDRDEWLNSCLLHVLHSRITGSRDWTDIDTCAMKDEWIELHDYAARWGEAHPGRLLVYDVREGWEPLCGFLGRDIPDVEFPHENTGSARLTEITAHMGDRRVVHLARLAHLARKDSV